MSKLIIGKEDQKEEWDEIWTDKHIINRVVNWGRIFYNKKWLKFLKKYSKVNEFAELGCGTSSLLAGLAMDAKHVTGIDYSPKALAGSRKKFKKLGIKNATFLKDNALKLKTKKKFDTVWSQGLIEHFEDPGIIIREHLKITKKNGHAVISGPYMYSYHFVWFLLTRPSFLRGLWPWTEQSFLTKKFIIKCLKKYCPKETDYKFKIFPILGIIILTVRKKH